MEEFDVEALLSSNEKTLIRLLDDYARVNHVVMFVVDNNGDLKSRVFGNTQTSATYLNVLHMKNMTQFMVKHFEFNCAYAEASIRITPIAQIVGKVCCISALDGLERSKISSLTLRLKDYAGLMKNLIETVGKILIDSQGIGNFMINYPMEVDDIIDELSEDNTAALQQLKKLSTSNDAIISAIEYIDENLDKHLTLDQVSSKVFLSDYYFSKLFKRETKLSFSVYLNARKIQKAMLILRQTRHSISEISDELGFTRMSYFSQTFKKYTGYTPSGFRNEDYLEI